MRNFRKLIRLVRALFSKSVYHPLSGMALKLLLRGMVVIKVPVNKLRFVHFQKGEIGVLESPHFKFACAWLESGEIESSYRDYKFGQHESTESELNLFEDKFVRLIEACRSGNKIDHVEARPSLNGLFLVTDGIHRAAALAACRKSRPITCRVRFMNHASN